MLTTCPECELPISDKALACPHCGYPLKSTTEPSKRTKRRMRLPNGFGQISELKGRNLRNPFRAMVTVGKDDLGRPICKTLKPKGYFKTYNEAYTALVEYNLSPYDLGDSILVDELYEKWSTRHFDSLSGTSLVKSYKAAWKRCEPIKNMRVVDVRPKHMKLCIDNAPTPNTKRVAKILLDLMFDYAVEYDMVDRNYARLFKLDKSVTKDAAANKKEHVSFSHDEICLLWENVDKVPYVDVILIQCYMGWRPQELCLLRIEAVNLEKGFITGGMKTDAGKERIVPIHENITGLVKRKYEESLSRGSEFLFCCPDSGNGILTYNKYRLRFASTMRSIGIDGHLPHDPRKTFVTLCKEARVDEYAVKYMVGHTISDITEAVYTDRSLDWLAQELSKVPVFPNM